MATLASMGYLRIRSNCDNALPETHVESKHVDTQNKRHCDYVPHSGNGNIRHLLIRMGHYKRRPTQHSRACGPTLSRLSCSLRHLNKEQNGSPLVEDSFNYDLQIHPQDLWVSPYCSITNHDPSRDLVLQQHVRLQHL